MNNLLHFVVFSCIFALTNCHKKQPEKYTTNNIPSYSTLSRQERIDKFMREGFNYNFTASPRGIKQTFGTPDSLDSTFVQNRHIPEQTDIEYQFAYNGLKIQLYWMPAKNEGFIDKIKVTSHRYEKILWQLTGGTSFEKLEETLSEPDDTVNSGIYKYVCCEQTVENPVFLIIQSDTIAGITWDYCLD